MNDSRAFAHVDGARQAAISELLRLGTVGKCWPRWQPVLERELGANPTADKVFGLGSKLSALFGTTRDVDDTAETRSQSSLSGGGTAWEALVAWYLNLCLIGTGAVVFQRRSHVPLCIRDALTVSYGAVKANTESDLVAISFPDDAHLVSPLKPGEHAIDRLAAVAARRFKELSVAVVQCKTNWNDNAQVPMLWDMIYHVATYSGKLSVGQNGYHIASLQSFRYAFATVPTGKVDRIKPTSLCVQRVAHLSGGNYWGRPTVNGVAQSLENIFPRVGIGPGGGKGCRHTLEANLQHLHARYSYFGLRPPLSLL